MQHDPESVPIHTALAAFRSAARLLVIVSALCITHTPASAQSSTPEQAVTSAPADDGPLYADKGPLPVLSPLPSPIETGTRPLAPPPWASQSIVNWQPANGPMHISAGAGKRRAGTNPLPSAQAPGTVLNLADGPDNAFDMRTLLESLSYYLGFGLKFPWFRSPWTLKADLGAIVQGDNASPGSATTITNPEATPFTFTLFDRSSLPVAIYPVVFVGFTRPF